MRPSLSQQTNLMSIPVDLTQLRWLQIRSFEHLTLLEHENHSLRREIAQLRAESRAKSTLQADKLVESLNSLLAHVHALRSQQELLSSSTKNDLAGIIYLHSLIGDVMRRRRRSHASPRREQKRDPEAFPAKSFTFQ